MYIWLVGYTQGGEYLFSGGEVRFIGNFLGGFDIFWLVGRGVEFCWGMRKGLVGMGDIYLFLGLFLVFLGMKERFELAFWFLKWYSLNRN